MFWNRDQWRKITFKPKIMLSSIVHACSHYEILLSRVFDKISVKITSRILLLWNHFQTFIFYCKILRENSLECSAKQNLCWIHVIFAKNGKREFLQFADSANVAFNFCSQNKKVRDREINHTTKQRMEKWKIYPHQEKKRNRQMNKVPK